MRGYFEAKVARMILMMRSMMDIPMENWRDGAIGSNQDREIQCVPKVPQDLVEVLRVND